METGYLLIVKSKNLFSFIPIQNIYNIPEKLLIIEVAVNDVPFFSIRD